MRVLVTFAVAAEFAPWQKLRQFKSVSCMNVQGFSAEIGSAEAVVLLTGVGGKQAWASAGKAMWGEGFDFCISTGLAGGLRAEHRAGEILAARAVYSVKRNQTVHCDSALVGRAATCGAKIVQLFRSENHVVVGNEEKERLGELADAVDMESGDVLSEISPWSVRGVAIRAISDTSEEELPIDFNRAVTPDGRVSIPRVLGQIARRPAGLPALVRFGQQSRRAAESLAVFLDAYVARLAKEPVPAILDSPVAAT